MLPVIDLSSFYPVSLVPSVSVLAREYLQTTYRDRFFIDPPAWFNAYLILELVYHLPLSFWMLGALYKSEYWLPRAGRKQYGFLYSNDVRSCARTTQPSNLRYGNSHHNTDLSGGDVELAREVWVFA